MRVGMSRPQYVNLEVRRSGQFGPTGHCGMLSDSMNWARQCPGFAFVICGLPSKGLAVPFLLREREGVLAAHLARLMGPLTGKG